MTFIIGTVVLALLAIGAWKFVESEDAPIIKVGARLFSTLALLVFVAYHSLVIVPPGYVYTGTLFGNVQEQPYEQGGPKLVNPLVDFTSASVRRQVVEFQSAGNTGDPNSDRVVSLSKDNLPLDIDVTFAYRLNPRWAPWIYKNIGAESVYRSTLIIPAARNASRDAVAQFTSDEATTSQRELVAEKMRETFELRLVETLVSQGLAEEEARQVFTILPVQLRKALPPRRVLNAIAEKEAAKQDLQRQETLTQIADEVARRRAKEGIGVSKLFAELPADFSPSQISVVLAALANKTRADALLKAVETEKVEVLVVPDGNPVSVNADPSGPQQQAAAE